MPELNAENYIIVSYKFHLTWIIIVAMIIISFKFFIGPWLFKSVEALGDRVITKFFGRIQKQLEEFKLELKEITRKDKKELNE